MGWPLAVSAALMDRKSSALTRAMWPLAIGHFVAMLVVLLPFALLVMLVEWQRHIRIAAAVTVLAFGMFRLVGPRHPRSLARIPPSQLGLWSFAVAIAHGAGLMLVPIYLGLCGTEMTDPGHEAARRLIGSHLVLAVVVSATHTLAMIIAGGLMAWLVYRYFGLRFIARSWFNLDGVWSLSLIAVGGLSLAITLTN
ncbi:MAG: hypothetical protein AB7E80_03900 [Hyphomicrobiaceae bacterium]